MDDEGFFVPRPGRRQSVWKAGKQLVRAATSALDGNGESCTESASRRLRQFLVDSCGSTLWAWLNIFDVDNDQRIDKMEFSEGMRKLNYSGKIAKLFAELDEDGSGELTMEEIDPIQSQVWMDFRTWCVESFDSVGEMLEALGNRSSSKSDSESRRQSTSKSDQVTESQFTEAIGKVGWTSGNAKLLFSALCSEKESVIRSANLKWLGVELRRRHKKSVAKIKMSHNLRRQKTVFMLNEQFDDFKKYLKKKYGNLVRVWRTVFQCTDSLILSKPAFLKACASMGYATHAKELWKVLDNDNSGFASLDEMDPKGAEVLAKFKAFIDSKFRSVSEAFAAVDKDGFQKVNVQQFDNALKRLGWDGSTKRLFSYLDKDSNKTLQERDLKFLEKWSPLPYLLVQPNEQAMEEVKQLLLQRYSNPLRAWRHFMDRDGDNHVNWGEFVQACKSFDYRGDVAGAWRAFDDDLSGYITLQEFDSEVSESLLEFRSWCHEEFGNVKAAFSVFDDDGSKRLSFQEFRGACRVYGFGGDIKRIFDCCDVAHEKSLSLQDVAFLDDWQVEDKDEDEVCAAGDLGDRSSVINLVRASVAQADAAAAADAAEDEDGHQDGARRDRYRWKTKVDDPMRLLKVLQVKQTMQQRFDMKLPPLLKNTSDDDHGDGDKCVREDQILPTFVPLSARTPRYCQARKDRERRRWKIKDRDQCRQFWLNYQMEEVSKRQQHQEQQQTQAMPTETADAENEVEQDADHVDPRDELPSSPVALLKPTLDQLLQQSPRARPQSLKILHKGHSHGHQKQLIGHGLSKLPLLQELGGLADQKTAVLGALRLMPFTAR